MRLIDAEKLRSEGLRVSCGINDKGIIFVPMKDIHKSIDNAPTVDAVEVVRCKDCEWYKETYSGSVVCQAWIDWIYTNENDFCSYGERREGVEE